MSRRLRQAPPPCGKGLPTADCHIAIMAIDLDGARPPAGLFGRIARSRPQRPNYPTPAKRSPTKARLAVTNVGFVSGFFIRDGACALGPVYNQGIIPARKGTTGGADYDKEINRRLLLAIHGQAGCQPN